MYLRYAIRIAVVLTSVAVFPSLQADQSGAAILGVNSVLNLETGAASGKFSDILWDGAALRPQGNAALYNLGKYGSRVFKAIAARSASSAPFSSAPISASLLVAGDIFGVRTNNGRYAKAIVTEASGGSLSISYTTFGGSGGAASAASGSSTPTIVQVQNNYSYILPGLPNYGIAPGSLFVIVGTNLSAAIAPVLQSSAGSGLPLTLNQTSVSVTVNGVTTKPALYYTSATQVAAVLPSTTPVGKGTITVTYNGQASAPAPIQVVTSAVGLDTLYGTGNGAGVATDNNGNVFGLTNSATPGQTIILWGSGIGADTGSDDRTYPQSLNNLSIPTEIYIGGISANVLYRGRSQYPGLDQFNVVIPANVTPGCFVSVVLATGSVVSNSVTIPVNPSAGACSDAASGLSGPQLQTLANNASGNVNSVTLAVSQTVQPNGISSSAAFGIAGGLSSAFFGKGYEYASQGSCTIVPPEQGASSNLGQPLDAGAIQLSGPTGNVSLTAGGGFYQANLSAAAVTNSPGTYAFTGSGGKNVGSFKASVPVQGALALTNRAALSTITRSQGATVTWSGGFPNGDVEVAGAVGDQYGSVRFFCHAPSSAGQFTIPASILLAMPAGFGSLDITNATAPQSVTASGADVGLALGILVFKLNVTYK